jgi:hypothetical protein
MRLLACVLCLSAVWIGASQASPDFPAGSEAGERKLLAKLEPYWQNWVKEQARTMVSSGHISEDRARTLAQGAHMAAGADVNSVSFLLLMQAARDADADLQATMDQSRDQRAEQDELSNMAHTRTPPVSQLSPETQTVLSMKGTTRPVMTLHSTEAPAPSPAGSPAAEADLSIHLDLQTAMDREAAAEDALTSAAKRVGASTGFSNQ